MNLDLQNYVNVARQQGKTNEVIIQELLGAGWNNNDINEVLGIGGKTSRFKYFVILFALFVAVVVGGYIFYINQKIQTPVESLKGNYPTSARDAIYKLFDAEAKEKLSVVPIVRKLEPGDFKNSTSYNFEKINFKVPFSDLVKETKGEISLKLQFGDNKTVAILEKEAEINELVNEFLSANKENSDKIKEVVGLENLTSTYNFLKLVFNLTPEIAKNTTDEAKQNVEIALLVAKSATMISLEDTKPVIYNFESKNVRGFQHYALDNTNKIVEIFDNYNNSYIILANNLSQQEMDYIIYSVTTK